MPSLAAPGTFEPRACSHAGSSGLPTTWDAEEPKQSAFSVDDHACVSGARLLQGERRFRAARPGPSRAARELDDIEQVPRVRAPSGGGGIFVERAQLHENARFTREPLRAAVVLKAVESPRGTSGQAGLEPTKASHKA